MHRRLPLGAMLRFRLAHFHPDTEAGGAAAGGTGGEGTGAPAAGAGDSAPPAAGAGAAPPADGAVPPDAGAAGGAAAAVPAVPAVPDTYTLTLPEDSALDAAALERTAAFARERGLSQEQAQQALEFLNTEVAAQREALLHAYQPGGAAWATQVDGWKADALADQALGKTAEERTAAIQRGHAVVRKYAEQQPADAEAMKGFLNDSGLGNHPAAVRFFAWIGKAMSEGSLALPSAQGGSTDADRLAKLYPSMNPQ